MSIRPTSFLKDTVWKWDIRLTNLAGVAVNADSIPTITVYKGGDPTGESVTVTKPSATTGWYQCSFDPAGEAEGNVYGFAEVAVISGITTPPHHWHATVLAPERGTNSAATASDVNAAAAAVIAHGDGAGDWGGGGGVAGLTEPQAAQLTAIAERTALITGAALSSAGAVTPGGRILLIVGNDHVASASSSLTRTISDPGGVLHARLTAVGTTLQFGAGRGRESQQISGTVTGATYSAGVTSISIEITHSQISATAPAADDYEYQIQRKTSAGLQVVEVRGDLTLERRRVNRV